MQQFSANGRDTGKSGVSYLVGFMVVLGVVLENFGLFGVDKVLHDFVHLKILSPGLALAVHLLGQ